MRSQPTVLSPRHSRWASALLTAALFTALELLGTPAYAAPTDDLSWSIRPGGTDSRTNFGYELEAGDKKKDTFEVTNMGSKEISLSIYAADGITSSTGALDLLPVEEPSTFVGSWVTVTKPEITLSPGETESVDFALEVPTDIEPGDYVGGLISSYLDSTGGGTVAVNQRLANRVNIRVGGEGIVALEAGALEVETPLAWNPFTSALATVTFSMHNAGTVRARSTYSITTSGPFGWGKSTESFASDELLPGATVNLTQQIDGIWPLFLLNASISVAPEGIDGTSGTEQVTSISSWAVPWGQLGLVALLLSVALMIGLRRGRIYEEDIADEPEAHALNSSTRH